MRVAFPGLRRAVTWVSTGKQLHGLPRRTGNMPSPSRTIDSGNSRAQKQHLPESTHLPFMDTPLSHGLGKQCRSLVRRGPRTCALPRVFNDFKLLLILNRPLSVPSQPPCSLRHWPRRPRRRVRYGALRMHRRRRAPRRHRRMGSASSRLTPISARIAARKSLRSLASVCARR